MRRYLAYCPDEEPRIFRMLDLISRGLLAMALCICCSFLLLNLALPGTGMKGAGASFSPSPQDDGSHSAFLLLHFGCLAMSCICSVSGEEGFSVCPVWHFYASILDAWRYRVFAGFLQLLSSSHPRERDNMLLRAILCGGVWNGFLLGRAKKEDVPCRLCGKRDGDGHLFWECAFPPLLHVRELPEFTSLMAHDKSKWPRCLLVWLVTWT